MSNNFGVWTVPEGRAAWIPAGMRHSIEPLPRAQTRTLYIENRMIRRSAEGAKADRMAGAKADRMAGAKADRMAGAKADRVAGAKADRIVVLHVTPLMRAIVDHVCEPKANLTTTGSKHLLAVFLDQLPHQRELPLFVPTLKSPLALRAAKALASDPADLPRIHDLAVELGVSDRTLERAFTTDASMSLGEWRQRARICRAIRLLSAGGAVQDVALEVGYETPSAFVLAFKKFVGATPGKTGVFRG